MIGQLSLRAKTRIALDLLLGVIAFYLGANVTGDSVLWTRLYWWLFGAQTILSSAPGRDFVAALPIASQVRKVTSLVSLGGLLVAIPAFLATPLLGIQSGIGFYVWLIGIAAKNFIGGESTPVAEPIWSPRVQWLYGKVSLGLVLVLIASILIKFGGNYAAEVGWQWAALLGGVILCGILIALLASYYERGKAKANAKH